VKTNIVRIGNSRGVRIPKSIIEMTGMDGEVDIAVKGDTIIISRVIKPRAGWDEAFAEMRANNDDVLLDSETLTTSSWDEDEWEW
jgi:antitoxin MazE